MTIKNRRADGRKTARIAQVSPIEYGVIPRLGTPTADGPNPSRDRSPAARRGTRVAAFIGQTGNMRTTRTTMMAASRSLFAPRDTQDPTMARVSVSRVPI